MSRKDKQKTKKESRTKMQHLVKEKQKNLPHLQPSTHSRCKIQIITLQSFNHEKIHYYQRQEKFLEYGYALSSNHDQPHKKNEQKNNENDPILKTEGISNTNNTNTFTACL